MSRTAAPAVVLAAGIFLAVLVGFGAALDGYSQVLHPPALLGARGIGHAGAFNLLGFMVPGLLLAAVAIALRGRLDGERASARIGPWLWLLSSLAFAAQGLLPLDPADLDAPASRLHATAWTLWWVAFVPGAGLLAIGLGRGRRWRSLRRAAAIAAVLLPLFALFSPPGVPAGLAQRAALLVWFACLLVAGIAAGRPAQP